MQIFNHLPGFRRTPAGMERTVLRGLPTALWVGSGLLCLPSVATVIWHWLSGNAAPFDSLTMLNIYSVSALILYWSTLIYVGIAAFIVMVMKGPAYVADAYPLMDSDAPLCR